MRHARSIVASAGEGSGPSLGVNLPDVGLWSAGFVRVTARAATDLPFTTSGRWRTDEPVAVAIETLTADAIGGKVVGRFTDDDESVTLVEGEGWIIALAADSGAWRTQVAAATAEQVDQISAAVAGLVPPHRPSARPEVVMAVWSEHPMGGGSARYATMPVGSWSAIESNYPPAVREQLAHLAATLPDRSLGGLVVFCGPAGTGKTRAIEALAHAWSGLDEPVELGVVVDSDRLLASAGYLADVLANAGGHRQVVVAEDVDEMVRASSNAAKTAETAKLLNVADGLVGRLSGAGTLLVLTANLERDAIADYITREGRAAAVVEFATFTTAEAQEWMAVNAPHIEAALDDRDGGYSLAELYGIARRG